MSIFIFVNGRQVIGYTSMSLTRSKEDLTGQLSLELFMNWLPDKPVMDEVTKGQEITVYIGEHLAFYGEVDRRKDVGATGGVTNGASRSLNIGPNQYKVTLSCRGKTGKLVDSSQQHPTGTMLQTTNKAAVEKLVEPWNIEVEWLAEVIDVPRVRFRDGARVVDEIERLAEQFSLYVFETRDGKLKVLDKADTATGEPIVLGTNILSFGTDQAADQERTEVTVKGQLTTPDRWGEAAVIPTIEKVQNQALEGIGFAPLTVQLFGDGTNDLLRRRAFYEMNRRTADGKKITVDVFHVQQTNGEPWDIGKLHYVEIPPAGVFGQFETIGVNYVANADGTLQTTLTLAPKPAAAPATTTDGVLDNLTDLVPDFDIDIAARISRFGVSALVSGWSSPDLIKLALTQLQNQGFAPILESVQNAISRPNLKLPPGFKGVDQ